MRTKIKICGLTSPEEAALLDPSHVDAAGMVLFCPKSKRNITIERAVEIMKALPKGIKKVAVTVSPTVEEADLAEKAGFDFLQVHGTMERDFVIHGGLPIIRAVNILEKIPVFEEHERIKAYLLMRPLREAEKPLTGSVWQRFPGMGENLYLPAGLLPLMWDRPSALSILTWWMFPPEWNMLTGKGRILPKWLPSSRQWRRRICGKACKGDGANFFLDKIIFPW